MTIVYFACFDFANGQAYGGANLASGSDAGQISISDFSLLSTVDNVKFYFCNDGINSASCNFDNTMVSYPTSPPLNLFTYLWGITRNPFVLFRKSHFRLNSNINKII